MTSRLIEVYPLVVLKASSLKIKVLGGLAPAGGSFPNLSKLLVIASNP